MGCELSRGGNGSALDKQIEKEKENQPVPVKTTSGKKNKRIKSESPSPKSVRKASSVAAKEVTHQNDLKENNVSSEPAPPLDDQGKQWTSAHELTPEQKDLIEETWKVLVDSIAEVGVIAFMRLFETHPDVQQAFLPFKELSAEELHFSRELRAHALRVMGFVQKVVARLREPKEKTESLLRTLGTNHITYGAKEQYVDLIGPQFVFAIKPSLEEQWSPEVEEAWLQIFRYMSDVMKDAMNRVREKKEAKDAAVKYTAT